MEQGAAGEVLGASAALERGDEGELGRGEAFPRRHGGCRGRSRWSEERAASSAAGGGGEEEEARAEVPVAMASAERWRSLAVDLCRGSISADRAPRRRRRREEEEEKKKERKGSRGFESHNLRFSQYISSTFSWFFFLVKYVLFKYWISCEEQES
jgi:hypothetical protein